MRGETLASFSLTLFIFASFSLNSAKSEIPDKKNVTSRHGKIFPLFNIVQFENSPCTSTSPFTGGASGSTARNGTCFTVNECTDKGGQSSGNCAAGFGVCCLFLVSASGGTITQNCTYIQNPGFPASSTENGQITYTVNKCANNVCSLRLDFETFTIQGTGLTTEVDGGVCLDTLTVTSQAGQMFPVICGQNTGQHIYVDMGGDVGDTATLAFNLAAGFAGARMYDIKVTQIPCGADFAAPNGCFQNHMGLTGRITTFNFLEANESHLRNQRYSVCVRQEAGFCCVQYMLCPDINSFSLDTSQAKSKVDSDCVKDFVTIAGSTTFCSQTNMPAIQLVNRYCGLFLNPLGDLEQSTPICDCTAPFSVDIVTDAVSDVDANADNVKLSRGLCLTYMQIPCQ